MKPNSLSLAHRLQKLEHQIEDVCKRAGRAREEVHLVAVSKGQSFEVLEEAYSLGLRDFGESYAQELHAKQSLAALKGLTDICWHFIGTMQSNKIRLIAQAQVIESVGTIRNAKLLEQVASAPCDIFLQVRLSDQEERYGFLPNEVITAYRQLVTLRLRIVGLMTILPLAPVKPASHWFSQMHQLRKSLNVPGLKLSMGMSNDYMEAIAYGADYIRIGTSLFGSKLCRDS